MKIIGTIRYKRNLLYGLFVRMCALSAAIVGLCACTFYDNASECPTITEQAEREYTVNITISANQPVSRATYELVGGNDDENFINIEDKDFAVFIIDAVSNSFLQRFNPDDISLEQDKTDIYKYKIQGTLTTKREITSIRILVLANWSGFGGNDVYDTFEASVKEKILDDIYTDASKFLFKMYNDDGVQTWMPSIENKKGIPMVGLSKNSIPLGSDQLLKPDETINMLRAIAKVEIVDNTEDGITGITLSCANANGRFVPNGIANPYWYKKEPGGTTTPCYVSTPSLPNSITYARNIAFVQQGEIEVEGKQRPVWVAYIPEMHVASSLRSDSQRPTFTLRTANESTTKFFDYYEGGQSFHDLGRYNEQLQSVLRNCIYSYTVSAASKFLELELEVLDWTMKKDEVFHFDNPQIQEDYDGDESHYLTWKLKKIVDGEEVDNGAKDMKDELRLYMMPGIDDYIEGTFTLAAPLNATWSASLVSLQGDLDSFEFVKEDDHDYSRGVIDGNLCTIRIKNKKEIVSNEHNEARLVIMVEYPDKTTKEAIVVKTIKLVTPGEEDQDGEVRFVKNYTIVQELTNFM